MAQAPSGGRDTPHAPRCYSLISINGAVPTTRTDVCVSRLLLLNSTSSNYTPSGVMPELCRAEWSRVQEDTERGSREPLI